MTDFPSLPSAINLKLLHTFMLVGNAQSFRVAADRSHRSGSAVSSQIRQLEEQLGLSLFHRTTRQVRLTQDGERLLQHVRRAMAEVEAGLIESRETASLQRGVVYLACAPTIASSCLAQVLVAFGQRYPGIRVYVREITAAALYESVRRGEVDLGVSVEFDAADLVFERLLLDEMVALVPRAWHDGPAPSITLKALSRMPLLVLEQGTALRDIVEKALASQRLELATRYQFMQSQTLISMAAAGLGAAVIPAIAVPEWLPPSIHKVKIVRPRMVRTIATVTLAGRSLSPAAARMAALLKELLGARATPS
ncbi:LysR family transcriptional regulator [Hydrogenophaga sp. BPS33]|uniref:LysR family transcriptional regulator n=1 Tax=Hydrogenophaga sp. BPS33 TaxID=2651974 RepID=UPI0013201C76|nr:LysR family transcriptional regulator [Hydrogenophaga sp. BPS33]QHE87856.1 LysR family transcriptional regulator [Hydrogenophaga sp. BPS33]